MNVLRRRPAGAAGTVQLERAEATPRWEPPSVLVYLDGLPDETSEQPTGEFLAASEHAR